MMHDNPKTELSESAPGEAAAHPAGRLIDLRIHLTPKQRQKAGLLALLVIGMNALFWFLFRLLLSVDAATFPRSTLIMWIIATFLIFFVMFAFIATLSLLVRDRLIVRGILLLAAMTNLLWFRLGWFTFLAIMLLILGYWYYDAKIKEEERERIVFSVAKSIRYGMRLTITLLLVAVSLTFYAKTAERRPAGASALDPISVAIGDSTNRLFVQQRGFDPDETLDAFFFRIATEQIGDQIRLPSRGGLGLDDVSSFTTTNLLDQLEQTQIEELVQQLPAEVRDRINQHPDQLDSILVEQEPTLAGLFSRERDRITASLGITATGETPMGEVVQQLIRKQLERYLGPYEYLLPPFIALSLFFALSIFGFLYTLCITLLTQLFFAIFKAIKFVAVQEVDTQAQVVKLADS
ncbi:MAG: hypothetical protein HY340_02960 [Candidatus Kerfeldbacteria bacterium]|nr:hypothetical protein [Candidatus Kerfeldbacteria bacterium]